MIKFFEVIKLSINKDKQTLLMRIFIDGYSSLAKEITNRLIKNHNIEISDIFVKTYNINNDYYLDFLEKKKNL